MDIQFNEEEAKNTKKEIDKLIQELEESCKKCYQIIDNTKEFFDTPTAKYFRELASDCILKSQKKLNGDVKDIVKKLNNVIDTYIETRKNINDMVKK